MSEKIPSRSVFRLHPWCFQMEQLFITQSRLWPTQAQKALAVIAWALDIRRERLMICGDCDEGLAVLHGRSRPLNCMYPGGWMLTAPACWAWPRSVTVLGTHRLLIETKILPWKAIFFNRKCYLCLGTFQPIRLKWEGGSEGGPTLMSANATSLGATVSI